MKSSKPCRIKKVLLSVVFLEFSSVLRQCACLNITILQCALVFNVGCRSFLCIASFLSAHGERRALDYCFLNVQTSETDTMNTLSLPFKMG